MPNGQDRWTERVSVFTLLSQVNRIRILRGDACTPKSQPLTTPVHPQQQMSEPATHPTPRQLDILGLIEHSDRYV